jgi:periplasmic divalent cation tolerance protein
VIEAPAVSVVLVTAPADAADRIVTAVVQERLAACGTIVPGVTSVYRWQGTVQRESEVLIVFKTAAARQVELAQRITELHPYEVPEVLALPVGAGTAPYVDWVLTNSNG